MEILQIVGLGLVATFLALIVKEHNPSFAFLLTVFVGVIIFIFLAEQIANIVAMLEELAESAQINMVYMETILKIIGIAYIAEFGAQIAKDAGQGAIASKIELGGKVIIMVMAIPIITAIIETVIGLLPN
ncbi:stage III sporulation protein AD [Texcoconibacillus texcoconensis]|uniref:stage III sporulation protein AD n=1 Tax=Texcoconibacillus texcoconensis TaxID=1095777 RepID=UPI0031B577E0